MRLLASDDVATLATTTISFISPHVDDQTQSILVKGIVANPSGTLRSSQFVRARIVWKTSQGLTVPVTAVLRINGQFFVFVAEDASGKLVGRVAHSDLSGYLCPSDPSIVSATERAGQFPDASCQSVTCAGCYAGPFPCGSLPDGGSDGAAPDAAPSD